MKQWFKIFLILVVMTFGAAVSHAQTFNIKPCPNDSATGTTQFTLTKINSSGNCLIMSTSDTSGFSGVCVANCGKTGTALLAYAGGTPLLVSNTATALDYIQISAVTAGDGADTGSSSYPTGGGDVIGRVQTGSPSGLTAIVDLNPEIQAKPVNAGNCPTIPALVSGDILTTDGTNCSWAAISNAPNTVTAVPGKFVASYDSSTQNFTLGKLALPSPIFAASDTLNDTVGTEQIFATTMAIPANTLIANVEYVFSIGMDTTATATIPNGTFKIYLGPTAGSLTGAHAIYSSTTTQAASGTFSYGADLHIQGSQAAGATATVYSSLMSGVGANYPIGRSTLATSQGNIQTNGTLNLIFTVAFSATGTGTNSMSIKRLSMAAGPLI